MSSATKEYARYCEEYDKSASEIAEFLYNLRIIVSAYDEDPFTTLRSQGITVNKLAASWELVRGNRSIHYSTVDMNRFCQVVYNKQECRRKAMELEGEVRKEGCGSLIRSWDSQ